MNIHNLYRRISPWFRHRRMAKFLGLLGPGERTAVLNFREMQQVFPGCQSFRERLFGLTESYLAVRT